MFDVLCTASDVHWRQHITVCRSVLGTFSTIVHDG